MAKKVVKINESQLNDIIKKVIEEQEAQVMNTGPSPEQVAGTPDNNTEDMTTDEPDFGQFIECAKNLMDQGITIGGLVDKLLETEDEEPEPEEGLPAPENGISPETPVA